MNDKLEVINPQSNALAAQERPLARVSGMLEAALKGGVTQENVAVAKDLMVLYKDMLKMDAEQQFNAAFVKMKSELPKIQAEETVENNDGSVRYKYAPLEHIQEKAKPAMEANGFSASFSQEYAEGRLISVCKLRHIAGHSEETRYGVRVAKGPPGCNEAQADGSTMSYANRGSFCGSLGISVSKDNDARLLGENIKPEQANEFMRRVRASGSDEVKFLKLATGIELGDSATKEEVEKAYASIPSSMWMMLDASLKKKENTRK